MNLFIVGVHKHLWIVGVHKHLWSVGVHKHLWSVGVHKHLLSVGVHKHLLSVGVAWRCDDDLIVQLKGKRHKVRVSRGRCCLQITGLLPLKEMVGLC